MRTFAALALVLLATAARAEDRPNILWITLEDLSPHLGSYGDSFARTPALDAFARESVRYRNAFATSPVCSPARSTLITGMYATSLGTQRLRSLFAVPAEIRPFAQYLRRAGYFTSNNEKTDYNLADEPAFIAAAWDENGPRAHWRHRKPGQPFFSVFNTMLTHQTRTSVWPIEQFEEEVGRHLVPSERADPRKVPIPPYYPDTALVRRSLARYYDCIQAADALFVRPLLQALAADGLADDTIVFVFSDHGSGIPRHKRMLHDSGLRVPLLVRFPPKYQHLAPARPGESTDRLVSFVDFAPTVLRLAGLPVPSHLQGSPFLPVEAAPPRRFVFGARDRVDEAFELSRSVRGARYLYVRNYMPHLSANQPEGFSDQAPMRVEIARLAAAGQLDPVQMSYAGPSKPREELYDTLADPHQIRNLVGSRAHAPVLAELRSALDVWTRETRDLGYLPESEVARLAGAQPPRAWAAARQRYDLERTRGTAALVGAPDAGEEQVRRLRDRDAAVRYWAAVGLGAAPALDTGAERALAAALRDPAPAVRIEAAAALLRHAEPPPRRALETLAAEIEGRSRPAAVHAARNIQLLGARAVAALREPLAARLARARGNEDPYELYVRFALEAALASEAARHR